MKRVRSYATDLLKAVRTIPKPSDFIRYIDQITPGPVVLYVRVSARTQKAQLRHQIIHLKTELEKRGFTVIAVYEEIIPGWEYAYSGRWGRPKLECAMAKAKEAKAVVVAHSVDRFRRRYDPDWKPRDPQPPLSLYDLNRLIDEADGVRLATLIHPDTPENEVRGEQTKRGQAGTGNHGGRPKESKKEKRLRLLPVAVELSKKGFSYRRIGRRLKAPWSTVRDWIKRKSAHPAAGD